MARNNRGTKKASKAWLDNYIANNTTDNNFTRKDNRKLKEVMSEAGLTYNQGQLERRIGKNKDISVGKGLQGKWDQAASNDSLTAQLSAPEGSSGEYVRAPASTPTPTPTPTPAPAPPPVDSNLNKRQKANMFLDNFISGATADGKFTATDLHDLNAKTTGHTWTDAQLHKRLNKSGANIGGNVSLKLGKAPEEGFDPSEFGLGNRISTGDVKAWQGQGKSNDYIQGQMDAANTSGTLKVGKNAQTYLNNQIDKAKAVLPPEDPVSTPPTKVADSGVGTVGGGVGTAPSAPDPVTATPELPSGGGMSDEEKYQAAFGNQEDTEELSHWQDTAGGAEDIAVGVEETTGGVEDTDSSTGFNPEEILTGAIDAANEAETQDPNEYLKNFSDEELRKYNLFRGTDAGGGTTVSGDGSAGGSIATAEGEGSQATGDNGMNLNLNSELELGDEVTLEGNIEGNEGPVNMGSGNQFGLDYDYNNEEDNRDQSVELHYSDDDVNQTVTSSYEIDNSGDNAYINAPTMNFASGGGGGALDNIQGTAAYGELLKGGRKHYGAAHANAAKSAIDNSPINQRKLGKAKGSLSNFFDFKANMAKYNALGKAGLGLGSFKWNSNPAAYDTKLPDLTA